jgi:hypothetical protein
LELFRGLAQRNKGRKTSYIDDQPASTWAESRLSAEGRTLADRDPISPDRRAPNFVPDLNLGMHLADAIAAGKPADIAGTKPFSGTDETKRKQMGGTSLPTRRRKRRLEAVMNHSMHSADRATHLKIVVMALVAGIAIAGFAISARTSSDYSQSAQVVKAGKPMAVTSSGASMVR